MNRSDRLIALVVLILVAGLAWFISSISEPEKTFYWQTGHYSESGWMSDEPYGAEIFLKYIQGLRPADSVRMNTKVPSELLVEYLEEGVSNVNYLMLGDQPWWNEEELDAVQRFVENGNSLFIFDEPYMPFLREIHYDDCIQFDSIQSTWGEMHLPYHVDSLVHVSFLHPELAELGDLTFEHIVMDDTMNFDWPHFPNELFCGNNKTYTPLSQLNDSVNFVRVAYGSGFIYLHTTPHLFTNIFLLTETGRTHAEAVTAHLTDGPIIYDLKYWHTSAEGGGGSGGSEREMDEGPFKYILSQPALKWAFYVLLGGVLLSLLFAFQRKERVVPVIHPKRNSSLAYLSTITELYLQHGGQVQIFEQMSEQLGHFLTSRYRIRPKDEAYYTLISKRTRYPESEVRKLKEIQDKGAHKPNITSELVVEYYGILKHFYDHCN